MEKVVFALAIILAAFVNQSIAMSRPATANNFMAGTVKFKAKTDTIIPIIVKHDTAAMSTKQLNHILNIMRQKRNDTQKIKVFKTGLKLVKGKGLKLDQLKTLLNQFLNDSSKLTCAEYAYPHTVDWKDFADLDNLFSTQDSKDKLDDFLKRNK